MNKQEQALNTLIQAVRIGNRRGAFEIEESKNIAEAIQVFQGQQAESKEEPGEKPE